MLDSRLGRPDSRMARALDTAARALVGAGVGANALSYAALACGLIAAWCFLVQHRALAFGWLVLSGLADAVDGRVARLGPGPTPWGGVLDLTFDRVVEAAVLLGIALPEPSWHRPALVLACTWYVNLCVFLAVGAASEQRGGKVIHYPPGLLERSEGLLFAFVVVVAPGWVPAAGYVYAALEVVTGAQRFLYGKWALQEHRDVRE